MKQSKFTPGDYIRGIVAVLIVLLLAGIYGSLFETRYYWVGRVCIKRSFIGRDPVAPSFCEAADRAKAAEQQRLKDLGLD